MLYAWVLTFVILGALALQSKQESVHLASLDQDAHDKYSQDILVVQKLRPVQQSNTLVDGTSEQFSWIGQDISQGNPISWSDQPNPVRPFRPAQNSLCHQIQHARNRLYHRTPCSTQAMMTIQGHGVPLAHELYTSREEEPSIFPFARSRASPLCCPASYTTSTGCVCGT